MFTIQRHHPSYEEFSSSQVKSSGRPALCLSLQCHLLGEPVTARGEANPLPGYGSDEIQSCEAELRALSLEKLLVTAERLCDRSVWGSEKIGEVLLGLSSSLKSPAGRFGIEMLALGAAAEACGVPMWRVLTSTARHQQLATSVVVDPFSPTWRALVASRVAQGVSTFKVKCGRDDRVELEACREMVGTLSGGKSLRLRLDPNSAWSERETARFASCGRELPVDWIEDPTSDPHAWPGIESPFPFAIDEPLGCLSAEAALDSGARFFVLKPMALGGFSSCLRWEKEARKAGRLVTLSHLFDGPIAFDATAHLAFVLQGHGVVPGLGAHQALSAGWPDQARTLRGAELILPD